MTKRISLQWWRASLLGLMVLGLITLWVLPGGSIVWATPNEARLRQTIPTLAESRTGRDLDALWPTCGR
jgi:hypothetical protein